MTANAGQNSVEGVVVVPKKIIKGIPCFDDSDFFYSEINREDTLALSALAATVGWKNAALGVRDGFVRRYIADTKRTLFLSIIGIKDGERVLDVGAGWGNVSAQIAKDFPGTKVYAIDKTVERLLFADQIKKQEHLENMRIMQCDILDPPFEANFFDVVIMIGVLEWLGAPVVNLSPRSAQERGLKAIYNMMRPGGRLMIGIENRIGHQYFRGHADHTGMAFTSLMPRRVADLYMKARGRGSYRTYTYSRSGYVQLLNKMGFKNVKVYAVLPDYRFPTTICDTDKLKDLKRKGLTRILPASFIGALSPSFYIVATR